MAWNCIGVIMRGTMQASGPRQRSWTAWGAMAKGAMSVHGSSPETSLFVQFLSRLPMLFLWQPHAKRHIFGQCASGTMSTG